MDRKKLCVMLWVTGLLFLARIALPATNLQGPAVDDQTIVSGIEEKLFQDSSLKQRDIRVDCKDGVVTLSGSVKTQLEKSATERIASVEPGVKQVVSQLRITGSASAGASHKPAAEEITISAGTVVTVRMIDSIDSKTNKPGEEFSATLESPLVSGERVVIPKNSEAKVRLVDAKQSGKMTGSSELQVELTALVANGTTYPVTTGYAVEKGASRGQSTAKRVGAGAVIGGLIGGIAGGGKGAAIGAGAGAATGGIVQAVTHGPQVKIPSEAKLDFTLKAPLTIKSHGSSQAQ